MLAPVHFYNNNGNDRNSTNFGEAFVMTGGGPAGATTTIAYYIYNNAFQWFKMGYATTIAWVLFFLAFSVTMFQWKFLGKKGTLSMKKSLLTKNNTICYVINRKYNYDYAIFMDVVYFFKRIR